MTRSFLAPKILRDRYHISSLIGGGGFSDTYLANDWDLPGKPPCVVKHLKIKYPSSGFTIIAQKLFDNEAEYLYQLGNEHPQIPRLFAHFCEEGQFYLVQEFIDGHDLSQEIILGQPKKEYQVVQLVKEILEVLAFVHQQGIIHRDIKPQNLMRRKDGKIILIDFGAVKEIGALKVNERGDSSLTVAIGTHGYMPNEQSNLNPQLSSDIYAVGIIAFQALTGLHPLQLPRDEDTGELHCGLFPQLANLNPEFAKILDTMVRYQYNQRYKDANSALAALCRYLDISQIPTIIKAPVNQSPVNQPPVNNSQSVLKPSVLQQIFGFFQRLFVGETLETLETPSNYVPPTVINPKTVNQVEESQPGQLFEQPEGQVSLASTFYIPRPPIENDCYEAILQIGALIRIKAPRQMGKTSLLMRVLDSGNQNGYQTANLNLQLADAESFTSLDKFLQWFCGSVAQELNLEDKLSQYWKGVLGSKDKCTNYFQQYLLKEINSPIVLGLDEVDQLFQHPQVASEFFGLLRAWHETSKNKEVWKKLRLVIVHSKEVYIPLNINQSPFNVGLPIELPAFNESQVRDLLQLHNLHWHDAEIEQFMVMFGGHPYLVRKALYEIVRDRFSLPKLLEISPTQQGFYYDHLRRHLVNLQEDSKLVGAMKRVITATEPIRIETGLAFKLRSMGLVKFQGNDVMPLCDLYRLYFREHL